MPDKGFGPQIANGLVQYTPVILDGGFAPLLSPCSVSANRSERSKQVMAQLEISCWVHGVAVAKLASGVDSLWEADSSKVMGVFSVSVKGAALRLLSPS
jgi:hypothetical protein